LISLFTKHLKRYNERNNGFRDPVLKFVDENIIGRDLIFDGPFGKRKVIYCDYTASGKSLKFIEDFIISVVLPHYGNTHTTTSVSSSRTSALRNESKQIIRDCLNCTEEDAVIFVSSGTTGAVWKLIHGLKLEQRPVVFISPYEHHSNILPWLEVGAEIIYGEENENGLIDLQSLTNALEEYSKTKRPLIGSFSAASNITGILTNVDDIATLLHRYGAYAFFDYATAGPYVEMNMNPHSKDQSKDKLSYKDAIFCSIHKFVGGPETPGLLVAKKHVFINSVPSGVGGGTVVYVTHNTHKYISDIEEREEGGTPAIVESIRAGLVFQLKSEVTSAKILEQEHRWVKLAYERWDKIKNLYILGKCSAVRLPIFSLVIVHPESKRLLHHNFVSALLNDLFGIQARGGCACAGPYAMDLLGVSSFNAARTIEALEGNFKSWDDISPEVKEKIDGHQYNILKPGFCRLNLPYFMDRSTIDFILDAVAFVAQHGWKFMPSYNVDTVTGDFKHKNNVADNHISMLKDMHLKQISEYEVGTTFKHHDYRTSHTYKELLTFAQKKSNKLFMHMKSKNISQIQNNKFFPEASVRWFLLPSEVPLYVQNIKTPTTYEPLFFPRGYVHPQKLRRTRLKSGSIYVKLCYCPMFEKQHRLSKQCQEYFQGKIADMNKINKEKKEEKQNWTSTKKYNGEIHVFY